jgi:hypothetical protein
MEIASGVASVALPQPDTTIKPDVLPAPEAGADEMARFQAAMSGATPAGGVTPGAAMPAEFTPLSEVTAVAAPGGTPGDAILRGLGQLGDRFDNTVDRITQTLDSVQPGQSLPAADMLRLQLAMTEVTVQQDVAGKLVGKATQNLDTFLKNQ